MRGCAIQLGAWAQGCFIGQVQSHLPGIDIGAEKIFSRPRLSLPVKMQHMVRLRSYSTTGYLQAWDFGAGRAYVC